MTSRLLRRSLGSPTYEPVQDELREATSTAPACCRCSAAIRMIPPVLSCRSCGSVCVFRVEGA